MKEDYKKITIRDLADLATLASKPEIQTLYKLLEIKQYNCMIDSFRIPDVDKELAVKRAHYRGQAFTCVKITKELKEAERNYNKAIKKEKGRD